MKQWWMLAVAGLLLGCGLNQEQRMQVPVTDGSGNQIPLTTECVGRVTVDLPLKGARDWNQNLDEQTIRRLSPDWDGDGFWPAVERHKRELELLAHDTEGNRLSEFRQLGENFARILSRRSESSTELYQVEHFMLLQGRAYEAVAEISAKNSAPRIERFYSDLLSITPRDNRDFVAAPGFCIDGGLLYGHTGEANVSVSLAVPGWKSARIGVIAIDNRRASQDGKGIGYPYEESLEREQALREEFAARAAEISIYPKDLDVLRRADRVLGGIPGREVVWRSRLNNGATLYTFGWETSPAAAASAHPQDFAIYLNVGSELEPDQPIPGEKVLFALWDAVLASVRPRPGAY